MDAALKNILVKSITNLINNISTEYLLAKDSKDGITTMYNINCNNALMRALIVVEQIEREYQKECKGK